ncbi:helix-turn-helix domain-containing protein [Ruminococcus sp. Marseille-P6503]|uniref:helix-turn-helix domain-containing protein n=1 Tax=Ruminococcus sp. Marseille-P6503 TaxID=2364796 RepID=UPI000F51BFFA|nr:helix-turn-helix domain-containing protein [Ruminococcus sp. Marseille-P6503]
MKEKITLGKFIQEKRKAKGLSQSQMAQQLFVTESAVSKWERGVSYPDISMIQGICEVLDISEHELLTASDDYRQREIEKQAESLKKTKRNYTWIWVAVYVISLIPCFIVNIAVSGALTWFFIVLTSEMVAFSLINLPVLVKKHKGLWTLCGFYVSIVLLLAFCRIYNGGNWFLTALLGVTLGLSVVFLPFVLKDGLFGDKIRRNKGLISMAADTVFLILLIISVSGIPSAALELLLALIVFPWAYLIVIRYLKINGMFKASICLALGGIWAVIQRPLISSILDGKPFRIEPINFADWSSPDYLNANIMTSICAVCVLLAVIFAISGAVIAAKSKK